MHDPNENRPGYRKTKVGWVPEEWECLPLGVQADIETGFAFKSECYSNAADDVRLLRGDNIVPGATRWRDAKRWPASEVSRLKRYLLAPCDIVLAMDRPWVGEGIKAAVIRKDDCPSLLVQRVARLRPSDGTLATFYISHISGKRFEYYIECNQQAGGGVPHISGRQITDFPIPLPPLPEQEKIAEILSTWDDAIEQSRDLIEAKKQQKKALMQQLLTGKRRLPGFGHVRERADSLLGHLPKDWPLRALSDVFSKVTRKNTRGVTRVLTASGESGLVDQRTFFTKSIASADVSGYYLLERGEFAYNRSAMNGYSYGAIKRLDAHDEGVLSTLYSCFSLKGDLGNNDFYTHLFEAGLLNRQLRRITQVGGRAHGLLNITDSDFFSVLIPVPDLSEQRAIAAVLDTADSEIQSLTDQLTALQWQKKGLMQRLLTGQVRVKVKE